MNQSCKRPLVVCSLFGFIIVSMALREEIMNYLSRFQDIHPMSVFFIALLVLIAVVIIGYVVYLIERHNKILNELSHKVQNLKSSSQITIEGSNTKILFKVIAYIGLFFCLLVAIHYLSCELPRLVNNDAANSHINNLGVDYLGLIVAIFAILVTLLVTWQIYSTIKVKEELENSKKDIEERFNDRLIKLEECCTNRGNEIKVIDKKVDDNHKLQDEKIETTQKDLTLYSKSMNEYSLAALHRQTFLLWENQLFIERRFEMKLTGAKGIRPFSTDLFNECFLRIGNALELSNKGTIKNGIAPIVRELYLLTNNVLVQKDNKGVIRPILRENIERVYNQIKTISPDDYDNVIEIIDNLKKIRNLRKRYENE